MSKETLKNLIELVPEKDIQTLYNVVIRFIPEVEALPDEVEAIARTDGETTDHEAINWE